MANLEAVSINGKSYNAQYNYQKPFFSMCI